jgi:DNA-directed RNA polymerase subunit RPC12/RpoP
MVEQNVMCHACGNIFRHRVNGGDGKQITCPACGGTDIRVLPPWVPLGSNLSEAAREWEYECQNCLYNFKLPVPDSPSQERYVRCPRCESGHIHRLTASGFEPLYCG